MPDIEGVPYETTGTALDVATAQALAARHREAAAPGTQAATVAAAALVAANAAATPGLVDTKIAGAITNLVTMTTFNQTVATLATKAQVDQKISDALEGFDPGTSGITFEDRALGAWSGAKTVAISGGAVRLHGGTLTGNGSLALTGTSPAEVTVFVNPNGHALTWGGTVVTGGDPVVLGASYAGGAWRYWGGALPVTEAPPVVDTQPPTTPTGLATSGLTGTSVKLTWAASTDDTGIAKYEVKRTGATAVHEVANGSYYTREWTFTGLSPSTAYTLSVRAVDLAGNTSGWATVNVTTTSGAANTAPTAPTNLQATPAQTTIALSWTAATDDAGVVAYRVSMDNGATWVTQTVTGTAYTVTGLTEGTAYQVAVQAGDAAGLWGPSATATVSTQAAVVDDSILAYGFSEGTGKTSAPARGTVPLTWTRDLGWTPGKNGGGIRGVQDGTWGSNPTAAPLNIDTTNMQGLTFMGWHQGPYGGKGGGTIGYLTRTTDNSGPQYHVMSLADTGEAIAINVRVNATLFQLTAPHTLVTDNTKWQHVAATWDKATGTLTAYWNGVSIGTLPTIAGGTLTGESTAQKLIGSMVLGYMNSSYPTSPLDEVRLFDRAVPASQIAAYMNQAV